VGQGGSGGVVGSCELGGVGGGAVCVCVGGGGGVTSYGCAHCTRAQAQMRAIVWRAQRGECTRDRATTVSFAA
jgi:hypothetical protein